MPFIESFGGDSDTLDGLDSTQFLRSDVSDSFTGDVLTVNKSVVINEEGGDNDFRLEGDTETNLLFADASTDRIGIGTNTPLGLFHVSGDNILVDNTRGLYALDSGGATPHMLIYYSSAEDTRIGRQGQTDILIEHGTGNVGIGTTSPNEKLDVNGKIRSVDAVYYPSDSILRTKPFQHNLATVDYVRSLDKSSVLSGILTHVDSDDQGDQAWGVWGDGRYVYIANYTGGLHVYSVDNSGILTHIDSDDQGGEALGVWGDGNFIYLANGTDGLHTYSVSDVGILTHLDSDDQGDTAWGVWGDGNFIYLANYTGGLHVYSVDNSGNLTHIDSDNQGDGAYGVWGDGNFIYLANSGGGLHTYAVSDVGILTHLDSDDQGDNAFSVWGDGRYVYIANYTGGLHVYSVDNAYEFDKGNQTHNFPIGNVGIGGTTYDATAEKVLQITGSTEPGGSVADTVQFYEKDSSQGAGHGTLGLYLEEAVEAIGTFTASHKLRVWINGTEYHIQLDAV